MTTLDSIATLAALLTPSLGVARGYLRVVCDGGEINW